MRSVWGQSYLHVQGTTDKFAELLPWPALNRILVEHRFTFPQLVLVKETTVVDERSYKEAVITRRGDVYSQILPKELNQKLREGHTLILDQIDQVYRPITDIARMLEFNFREHVQVNAYVAWGPSRALKAHPDDHDVFVLQVHGRKCWRIYGLSERGPLIGGDTKCLAPPNKVAWEAILEPGDLLYVPRNWWHEVRSDGEPSVHLTCGIQNRTGIDLLAWIQQELRSDDLFSADLPRFSDLTDQSVHIARLRNEICKRFDENVLARFLRDCESKTALRPSLSLPWSVIPGDVPQDDAISLRLAFDYPVELEILPDRESCAFVAGGRRLKFPKAFQVVLQVLIARRVCSMADLIDALSPQLDRDAVRGMASELVFQGLVAIDAKAPQ